MKVYAHYFNDKDYGNEYRWRTLMQFGSSWEVIGSIVMKNPGSSAPLRKVEEKSTLEQLYCFSSETDWFEFSKDNTMQCIEKLFKFYYQPKELNGVIQIFNLMNVRDPDLERAIERNNKINHPFSVTIVKDAENLVAPVYLGWGTLGFSSLFSEDAKYIFKKAIDKGVVGYLNKRFESNSFYHPQYLMGRGKNKPQSQYLLNAFCQNTQNPEYTCVIYPKFSYSASDILKLAKNEIISILGNTLKDWEKTLCFPLNKELEFRITLCEKGYVGIRHISFDSKIKYPNDIYPNWEKYANVLRKFGFKVLPKNGVWIGTKRFREFGYDNNSITENIAVEIKKIKELVSTI